MSNEPMEEAGARLADYAEEIDKLQRLVLDARIDRDEARAQRDWLIKECGRVGVTVNVRIGAPLAEAYELVNDLWRETQAQFNKMEARAISLDAQLAAAQLEVEERGRTIIHYKQEHEWMKRSLATYEKEGIRQAQEIADLRVQLDLAARLLSSHEGGAQ